MKLTATIVLSFQAPTLEEAGATLDGILAPARDHGDVEVTSVDLQTPSAGAPVTIPYVTSRPSQPSIGPAFMRTPS